MASRSTNVEPKLNASTPASATGGYNASPYAASRRSKRPCVGSHSPTTSWQAIACSRLQPEARQINAANSQPITPPKAAKLQIGSQPLRMTPAVGGPLRIKPEMHHAAPAATYCLPPSRIRYGLPRRLDLTLSANQTAKIAAND